MTKDLIALIFLGGAVMLIPSTSEARHTAQLMVGNPAGKDATLSFHDTPGDDGLRIETHLVGNPGAELSIWVDHSPTRLFARVLTTDDCKYGDDGARCRLVIAPDSFAYRQFVAAFKRGRAAHIQVENAGIMQMSSNVSLLGFARKFKSRS